MPHSDDSNCRWQAALLLVAIASLPACATRSFHIDTLDPVSVRGQAKTQQQEDVRVSTTVLGPSQSRQVFGVDLYGKNVQPVWIEVTNQSDRQIRFAPYGTDKDYFPAHEIAFKFRSGYSAGARASMARAFQELTMGRYVDPGETRSGFLFTNLNEGAKRINIDLFAGGEIRRFTFVLRVPGFVPDHLAMDFAALYGGEMRTFRDKQSLLSAIADLPCCTDPVNPLLPGYPVNIVLISHNYSFLYTLLHANWRESSTQQASQSQNMKYFDRNQDAIVRYVDRNGHGYYEMRLWLSSLKFDEKSVWIGQVRHHITGVAGITGPDPDLDLARNFTMQKFWLSAPTTTADWLDGEETPAADNLWNNIFATRFFTDGRTGVVWLLEDAVASYNIDGLRPAPGDSQ